MNKDLLTVAQVAERADVTTQAIYKQLQKQLQPYVVKVRNRTMLKNSVITEYFKINIEQLPTNTTVVANDMQPIYQPEPLKGRKAMSRRITKEHRLIYVGDENQNLLVIACKGHYED